MSMDNFVTALFFEKLNFIIHGLNKLNFSLELELNLFKNTNK